MSGNEIPDDMQMQFDDLAPEQPTVIPEDNVYYGEDPGGIIISQYETAYPVEPDTPVQLPS